MPRFNTASGMDCMQYDDYLFDDDSSSFNTASGMDCMQLMIVVGVVTAIMVSIPQAVWIACNTVPHSPWDS